MNLEFFPSPGGKDGTIDQPLGGKRLTDEHVLAGVEDKIAAKTAEKDAALADLEAVCAAAEREEAMLGSGSQQTGAIRELVLRITRLEGELEYLGRAFTGLGGEEDGE